MIWPIFYRICYWSHRNEASIVVEYLLPSAIGFTNVCADRFSQTTRLRDWCCTLRYTCIPKAGMLIVFCLPLCLQIFTGNQNTCLTIRPHQIKKIVELAAKHQDKAPEFLDLLCAIVKVEELNLPLKRNQGYVITNVLENYHRLVYMLESSQENRYIESPEYSISY